MAIHTLKITAADRPLTNLSKNILNGDIYLLKNCLQDIDLFDDLEQATFSGISNQLGEDVANKVRKSGVEKIHTVISALDIPDVTDSVYEAITPKALGFLKHFIHEVLGGPDSFYFERKPNVRFHIPHDNAAEYMKEFKKFSKKRGDGKITPHNPHRDSWVDCPNNLINVWIAGGPIKTGNSLTVYPETYKENIKNTGPYMSKGENPGPAETFDMDAGDVLLFHGDHVHGSEINSTDCTRHVISFRIVLEKPCYPYGHYHHYAHSKLAGGALDWFAEIPQNLAWSYIDYRVKLISRKLAELVGLGGKKVTAQVIQSSVELKSSKDGDSLVVPLTSLKQGDVQALSNKICITHLENGEVKAFSRHCPHQGADLSLGAMNAGRVMCPWHNLPLDPANGASPCQSLKSLKTYPCEVKGDQVYIAVAS